MRNWLRSGLAVLSLLLLAAVGYDRAVRSLWVGSTRLTVELLVADADTQQPIENAEILIAGESNRDSTQEDQPIRLSTNLDGVARHVCPAAMTVGQQSGLALTNTWSVAPLDWSLSVRAEGYEGVEGFTLTGPHRGTVVRDSPGHAKHVVTVSLRKARP